MEGVLLGIRSAPTKPAREIGADYVVIDQYVIIAETFNRLGIITDHRCIRADFSLWENDSEPHKSSFVDFSLNSIPPLSFVKIVRNFLIIPDSAIQMSEERTVRLSSRQAWNSEDTQPCSFKVFLLSS